VEQPELLKFISDILEQLDIPHMVVGSYASGFYGEPRMTQDIDIVIDPLPNQIDAIIAKLPPVDFYVSREAAMEALRTRGQFNVIDSSSAMKIDFMISRSSAWGENQLTRRVRHELMDGITTFTARPEDVILSKLLYYKEGGSEKHLRDITSMFRVSGDQIDRRYIEHWVKQLALVDEWEAVLQRISMP
jgi:hypothetical protein